MSVLRKIKVLVVAGGSGGHILPAVSFCQELKQECADRIEIYFMTTVGKKGFEEIPSDFNPILAKINKSPLGLLKLSYYALFHMIKIWPDVVFGFGGYIAVPFIVLAKLLRKKTLIHEQNVLPGRANRFLSSIVDKIAISFSATQKYLKGHEKKIFLSRYPLRESLKMINKTDALKFFGFQNGYFTILVMGGSQGAHRINKIFLESLRTNDHLGTFQIIHLSGSFDFSMVQDSYRDLSVKSKVFAFLKEMHYAYSAVDLVIGRSGAGAVHEIMYFGLPSILIPYPYAGAHQRENARFLAEKGASILLEEDRASPQRINELLDIFKDDGIRRKTMSAIAMSLYEQSKNLKLSYLIFS